MFIYTSPNGGSAVVEERDVTAIIDGVPKTKIVWSGGGHWWAREDQLSGRLTDEKDLEYLSNTEHQAIMDRIMSATAAPVVTPEE